MDALKELYQSLIVLDDTIAVKKSLQEQTHTLWQKN